MKIISSVLCGFSRVMVKYWSFSTAQNKPGQTLQREEMFLLSFELTAAVEEFPYNHNNKKNIYDNMCLNISDAES